MHDIAQPYAPPGLEERVRELAEAVKLARDLAAGSAPQAAAGREAVAKARAAMQEGEAILLVLGALRERTLAAHDLAAEIVRQAEGVAA